MDEKPLDAAALEVMMAANPPRDDYTAWRVVTYDPDGTFRFVPNRSGLDWVTERNAKREAARLNGIWAASGRMTVARLFRVKVEEVLP